MGFMDLLKSAPQPQQINQDGKQYTFTPGSNGSLVSKPNPAPTQTPLNLNMVKKDPDQKAKAIIAAVRG